MLAIFRKNVAKIKVPENFKQPVPGSVSVMEDKSLLEFFATQYQNSFGVDLKPDCIIRATPDTGPYMPGLFASNDDLHCMTLGRIKNLDNQLSALRNVNCNLDQPSILMEAYKMLMREGPEELAWLHFVRQLTGKFALVIFDHRTNKMFAGMDSEADGRVPFFWRTDFEGNLMFSSNQKVIMKRVDGAYGEFPKGSYVSTGYGLRKFLAPMKKVKLSQADCSGITCSSSVGSSSTHTLSKSSF